MQLEQIVVGMRPRTGFEALDLGFALVRSAFRDIYLALLVVALPLAALAVGLAYLTEPLWGWLLLWWMKPMLDAVVLSVLARALIGERIRPRRVFTEIPKALQRHLWGALTFRRLSPSRTFTMPVRHLEGLKRKEASRRIAVLSANSRSNAQLACAVLVVFEIGLVFAGLQMMGMFTSTPMTNETAFFPDNIVPVAAVLNTFVASLIIEPVFAAMGFALYVNRRVELEGWDLELAFRALRARAQKKAGVSKVASLVAVLALLVLPLTASAQSDEVVGPPKPPAKVIKDVLAHPDFDPWRPTDRWIPVEKPKEEKEEDPEIQSSGGIPFAQLGVIIAEAMPYVLGALGLALITHLTVIMLRSRSPRSSESFAGALEQLEALPAKRRPLPDDVVGFARAAWQRGEQALALSILYRGAIGHFAHVVAIDFPEGATEQECVALVRRKVATSPASDAFATIARSWQRCAYAHTLPSSDEFQALSQTFSVSFVAPRVAEEPAA